MTFLLRYAQSQPPWAPLSRCDAGCDDDSAAAQQFHNVRVRVSDTVPTTSDPPDTLISTTCAYLDGVQSARDSYITCPAGTHGRYLSIQIEDTSVLYLCEAFVYGSHLPSPPPPPPPSPPPPLSPAPR